MRVTVLGKSPAWQDADGACSGYLVETDDTSMLLDCGNGVLGKLRARRDYTRVDAILITHMHADHFFDLIPYGFALTYSPRQQPVPVARWDGVEVPARPKLFLPPGGLATLQRVANTLHAKNMIEEAFRVTEYHHMDVITIGSITVQFKPVPHFVETYAVALTSPNRRRFVFGADSRPNDDIIEFARGCDLLMLEATLPRPERSGVRGHMTAGEAGEHAAAAAPKQLVLTHISDELDPLWALSEARRSYDGPTVVATEGAIYSV